MRNRISLLAAGLCVLLAGVALAGPDGKPAAQAEERVPLKFKAARSWPYDLPAQRFRPVSGAFDFTEAGGARFAAALEGDALAVDTDGDGATDVKVTGKEGFVRFTTKGEKPFTYAVRLVNTGGGWQYAAGGVRVGKIGETRITLIDQNGDGRYDGYGEDAMIVGRSKSACFFSRAANVGGELRSIVVNKEGSDLYHAPWRGAAGTLDLASQWDAQAKLQSVVVRSVDGRFSFDLAKAPAGMKVPAQRYVLHSGKLGLGENVVRFTRGRAKPLTVEKDATTIVPAGGPLRAEFAYQRNGPEVVFNPGTLRYFGRAGEEYVGWKPFGKSPVFSVRDAGTRKEIAQAIFTGC